jgi:aldose sugar dehydrogenase
LIDRENGGTAFILLVSKGLVRVALDGDQVMGEERLALGARIKDVVQGPDGAVYVLTDQDDGEILRLAPGDADAAAQMTGNR